MKITKKRLKQIIKEELNRGLNELKVLSELDDLGALVGGFLLEGATKDAKEQFNKTLSAALMKGVDWDKLFKTLKIMPKGKQAHSYRVGGHAAVAGERPSTMGPVRMSSREDATIGALMHDYIERAEEAGIDPVEAAQELVDTGLLTDTQKQIIIALTSTKAETEAYSGPNEPLHHMKKVFKNIKHAGIADTLAMIKVGDRVDNLNRRVLEPERGKGHITKKKYLKKSVDLINFLRSAASDTTQVDAVLNRLEPEAKQALVNFAPEVFADFGWSGEVAVA